MKVKKELILRNIAGDYVLVPIGEAMGEYSGLFVVSEVGARIWELLPECDSRQKIVDILLNEYEVEKNVLEQDVEKFMTELEKLGII